MKTRKLFVLPAICCALALTLGAYGEEKQENAKAKAEAEGKAKLIFRKDGKTITGVKAKGIKSVVIPNGVTSIGRKAFSGCKSLTSITIPDSVTSIGEWAFSGCKNLTSITIPDKVTSIGDGAFWGVQSVQVSTKNPVFSVDGSGVLINKKEKKLLYAPPSLSGNYTIPDSVTSIGEGAFFDCFKLPSVTIPDSVTSIGAEAFRGCKSLTSITIPDSVTSIGDYAFFFCSSLPSVTIPDSVTSIGHSAFFGCSSLTSINIPDSVTSIGRGAFFCVKNVNYAPAFFFDSNHFLFNKKHNTLVSAPITLSGSYTIPDSVTSIGDGAFSGCSNLTSITIPAKFTDKNVKSWKLPFNCKIIRK